MSPGQAPSALATGSACRIGLVIPCYRVGASVLALLPSIPSLVTTIYVVDDASPDGSADLIAQAAPNPRLRLLRRQTNGGVGAAVKDGLMAALADGHDILVKLDGDGQMDPAEIPRLVAPLLSGEADFAKGNRFFQPEGLAAMPRGRLLGNIALSFLAKLSTGYWQSFDSVNGFVALQASVAHHLPWAKIHDRFLFESDLLFRLGLLRARVVEVPTTTRYGTERSNLKPLRAILPFLLRHLANTARRVTYSYFLRGFSVPSLELLLALLLLPFGLIFGLAHWRAEAPAATAGTVMLSALPIILGVQFLLGWINADIAGEPRVPIHRRLAGVAPAPSVGPPPA